MSLTDIWSLAASVRDAAVRWAPRVGVNPHLDNFCVSATEALCATIPGACPVGGRFDDEFGHCWAEVDGVIVDVTATQFGLPDVCLFGYWTPERCRYNARVRGAYALHIPRSLFAEQKRLVEALPSRWWEL